MIVRGKTFIGKTEIKEGRVTDQQILIEAIDKAGVFIVAKHIKPRHGARGTAPVLLRKIASVAILKRSNEHAKKVVATSLHVTDDTA